MHAALVLLALPLSLSGTLADYRTDSGAWNGLATLAELSAAAGCPLHPAGTLDWRLHPTDVPLFFIYPLTPPDPAALDRFLTSGGRALIADDFGAATATLAHLGIRRASVPGTSAHYRDNDALVLAIAARQSELGRSTQVIITNHPSAFDTRLPPTFRFTDAAAVVVEGRLGRGEFVALSDPSLLINNMLELGENRRFAQALIGHFCQRAHPIVVYTQAFDQRGTPISSAAETSPSGVSSTGATNRTTPAPASGSATEVLQALRQRGHDVTQALRARLGGAAVPTLFGVAATLLGVVLLRRMLPWRAPPYTGHWTRVALPPGGGFEGLVQRYAAGELPWGDPLLGALLRDEVILRLEELLGAPVSLVELTPRALAAQVAQRGTDRAGVVAARLWRMLRDLPHAGKPGQKLSQRRLIRMHHLAMLLWHELGQGSPEGRLEVAGSPRSFDARSART